MKEDVYIESPSAMPTSGVLRRVSWGAILAGFFVTVIIQVILTMLGVAIGAGTINPITEENPARGLATGAAIWVVVSGLISLFSGAWVAGRLSGGPRRLDGLLHGVVTFSVAEVAMILLVTTGLGAAIGGTGSLINQAMGSNVGQEMQTRIEQAVPQGGANLPGEIAPPTEQRLREAGDAAARGLSKGAFWAFAGMVLGLGIAAWGGWVGTASLPRLQAATLTVPTSEA